MQQSELHSDLLVAHKQNDKTALILLYQKAAKQADGTDARAFFLTYAYIYALETGHADAAALRQDLCDLGREV